MRFASPSGVTPAPMFLVRDIGHNDPHPPVTVPEGGPDAAYYAAVAQQPGHAVCRAVAAAHMAGAERVVTLESGSCYADRVAGPHQIVTWEQGWAGFSWAVSSLLAEPAPSGQAVMIITATELWEDIRTWLGERVIADAHAHNIELHDLNFDVPAQLWVEAKSLWAGLLRQLRDSAWTVLLVSRATVRLLEHGTVTEADYVYEVEKSTPSVVNGIVDPGDLAATLAAWGQHTSAAAIPIQNGMPGLGVKEATAKNMLVRQSHGQLVAAGVNGDEALVLAKEIASETWRHLVPETWRHLVPAGSRGAMPDAVVEMLQREVAADTDGYLMAAVPTTVDADPVFDDAAVAVEPAAPAVREAAEFIEKAARNKVK